MKRTVLASAFLALAASSVQAESLVKVDGSSTVYPVTEAVAEDFQKSVKGEIKVTVGISGTGGGFKKFCRGEIDVANASRPILKKEMEDCAKEGITYYELPVAFDALTVVVNPKSKITQLSVAQLKKMWEPDAQGKVSNWNQVDPSFPDAPLNFFGAGSDSGTFDYFTEAINGKSKASRGDYTASEDDNVLVQGVSRDVNAIGYFGYAYYAENQGKLKAVAIVNAKGEAVLPSEKSVIDGSYNPLARPIFIYVSAKALERAEVRQFVDFYMKSAPALTSEVKYVPLPAKAYEANMEHMKSKKLGTVFGGHADVGVTIEELISREAKL